MVEGGTRTHAPSRLPAGGVALIVVDDERNCLEANLAASRILGVARDQLVGHTLDEFFAESMGERLENVWRAFRDGGGHAGPFELAAPAPDAHAIDINVTSGVLAGRHLVIISPVEAPSGRLRGGELKRLPASGSSEGGSRPRTPTAREREILALLATGSTDGQIARALALSPATVQTHVRNAKAKLGARTRAQAVAMAMRRGMISA